MPFGFGVNTIDFKAFYHKSKRTCNKSFISFCEIFGKSFCSEPNEFGDEKYYEYAWTTSAITENVDSTMMVISSLDKIVKFKGWKSCATNPGITYELQDSKYAY